MDDEILEQGFSMCREEKERKRTIKYETMYVQERRVVDR